MNPKLIVEQKITPLVNRYIVFTTDQRAEKSQQVAFVQQKRLAFKERESFYNDESQKELLFTLRAEKVLDVHGRYLVEDVEGNFIGAFKKDFTKSLLNSTWNILDKKGEPKIVVSESNQFLAAIRRFAGFIPIVGELVEMILLFFRYHFTFKNVSTGEEVGRYQKMTLLRDHYLFSMNDSTYSMQGLACDGSNERSAGRFAEPLGCQDTSV